jgi:hypothetical protein
VNVVNQVAPAKNDCTGDPSTCLSGTAFTAPLDGGPAEGGSFLAAPSHVCAFLYRTYPERASPTAAPAQLVAMDGTWAFSGLSPWEHYYVQIVDDFSYADAGATTVTIVGPVVVPVAGGQTVAVEAKPVELTLLETKLPGAAPVVQSAVARLSNPATGLKVEGAAAAQVTLDVGGAPTPMPWNAAVSAFFVQFATPPPAQASYTITTQLAGAGAQTWTLQADPPTFDGAITTPAPGGAVEAGAPLVVTWPPQPAADFELTEVFGQQDAGGWNPTPIYVSPAPLESRATSETVPVAAGAYGAAGTYLVNVLFAKANCPADASGCVIASSIASSQITAQ